MSKVELKYLTKRQPKPFDFTEHFRIYKQASDLFDNKAIDVFKEDKISNFHFFSAYSGLLNLLNECGFQPTLIENSLFIAQELNPKEPEYLLVVFNEDQDLLKSYVRGVKKNIKGLKAGERQFNSIVHHKELTTNPYYYKKYFSNVFAQKAIDPSLKNIEYRINRYKRKPVDDKGIGELLSAINTFFDMVLSEYSAESKDEKGNTNSNDLAILIPFPRPGISFLRHINLTGGGLFLFGSMDKDRSVENLISRIRQYFVDSLLQQSMLKATMDARDINSQENWVHWIKSNLDRNVIQKLHALRNSPKDLEKLSHAISYTEKFKGDAVNLLNALRLEHEELDHKECKDIIEKSVKRFLHGSDIDYQLVYNYSNQSLIHTQRAGLRIIMDMLLDNAVKYMNKAWSRSLQPISGRKTVIVEISEMWENTLGSYCVSIFNNGTTVTQDKKFHAGKIPARTNLDGSTGWGHIIINESLKKMDAIPYSETDSYLKVDNTHKNNMNGVEVEFRLRRTK